MERLSEPVHPPLVDWLPSVARIGWTSGIAVTFELEERVLEDITKIVHTPTVARWVPPIDGLGLYV